MIYFNHLSVFFNKNLVTYMHQKKLLLPLKFSNLEFFFGSRSHIEFINAANAENVFVSSLLQYELSGSVRYHNSNTCFQFLNNITCIFTHFFTHTYFYTFFSNTCFQFSNACTKHPLNFGNNKPYNRVNHIIIEVATSGRGV